MNRKKMVDRRVNKGNDREDSERLLVAIIRTHSGDNLAHSLVYNDFATEAGAYKYLAS